MVPTRKIEPPEWMTNYRATMLMRVLGGFDTPAQALFVGGCVRNTLIGKPVNDIDIATIHHPLEVIEKLTAEGIRFVPTGLDHGTVTAIVDDISYEITTLRKDIETDGRHAVIAFTNDWHEDAMRRDFTMNTLLASADGMIFDPTGSGIEHLDERRVVFVGDAEERIAEDYLRILRFFRFYAQYGEGDPDQDALVACKKYADKMRVLSKERITQEFLKILAVPQAASILDLMFSHDVLKGITEKYDSAAMRLLCATQQKFEAVDAMARLFVLSASIENLGRFLVLSNVQKRQIENYGEGLDVLKSVSKKKTRELIYRVGNAAAMQVYFIKLAKNNDLPDLEIVDIARYWQAPEFPVSGNDLIDAGILPGPELGKKLKALEDTWISKDFPIDFSAKK